VWGASQRGLPGAVAVGGMGCAGWWAGASEVRSERLPHAPQLSLRQPESRAGKRPPLPSNFRGLKPPISTRTPQLEGYGYRFRTASR
jgi:hypothetical protein